MKRVLLLLILFTTCAGAVSAQEGRAMLGVKGGHNALFGHYASISADVDYEAQRHFAIYGGAQYGTIGSVAAELRPQYFHDFNFGRLSGELLLGGVYQGSVHNYVVGCGVELDVSYIWATLGYYHRTLKLGNESLLEPFNIYYELGIRCLPMCKLWDLNVVVTNSRHFEVERHYQPSLSVDAWWYPCDRFALQFGVCYKPAGMFHISSDYYQLYASVGVCYRW